MMRIAKKLGLLLVIGALVLLSLPVHIAGASSTTVEINHGNTITLGIGQSVIASGTNGISVAVKGLPNLGAPANGLAAFAFDISWDKNVIKVDTIKSSADALGGRGWTIIVPPAPYDGTVRVAGYTTTFSTGDIILVYLGTIAVGSAGSSTSINVAITSLFDKDNVTIPATPVNAPVEISSGTAPSTEATTPAPTVTEAKTDEGVVPPVSAEPGVTSVPGSANESGVFTEKTTTRPEVSSQVEPATAESTSSEGSTTAEVATAKPINWGLIGGIIAGVVVVGVAIWLALRRRRA